MEILIIEVLLYICMCYIKQLAIKTNIRIFFGVDILVATDQ